ncbi:hypothetical protein EUTSA_v10023068mg [Eutrema salsugineum]|uniref:DUF241 domain-containing protein n=1 Tax=Eutrema salsugineum TaxID=72664 RepID=V4ME54_EUTSA|nr:uncharacterized protein LOC18026289 [Eutrema salsugineum]ESQ50808.1 hypothetical protein EUTSA_v10023068mg [Eutrema salsugineum]
MAFSFHVRSNSFPSRPHPQAAHVDEQLARLRSSEKASTSSISSICKKLDSLQELHESLDKLIRLPVTQHALAQDKNKKAVEQLLDGSLKILDLCNISKDALSQMKESLMEIQSILRRKRGDLSGEVKKYLASRKSLKKTFQKVQKPLKVAQDGESFAIFEEAEAVTIALFDSIFSYMSGSKNWGKWSVVSKLMNKKIVIFEAQANEFTRVDSKFQSENTLKIEDVQILVSCIQDLEDGVESLSKSLVKYRVSVLNTLGQ